MDNKLSELSKPVMYVVRTLDGSVASVKAHNYTAPKGFTSDPLYSQEYVSALLSVVEEKDKRIVTLTEEREFWRERVEGAEKEREEFRRRFNLERSCLEDADKRIRALDMRNAELNSTIERWATDRAESANHIDELEAKLATPVRLPVVLMGYQSDDYRLGFMEGVEKSREEVRSAGFTVEGDE